MKKLFLLCLCLIIFCSCDTSVTTSTPTDTLMATPISIPQAFLGGTLEDFRAYFANIGNMAETGSGDFYLFNNTSFFNLDHPNYSINLTNGKVNSVNVLANARNKGAACTAFLPKDKKLISSSQLGGSSSVPSAMTIYESKWLAKQFPASAFIDQTNLTDSNQPQPLATPGTLSLTWVYVSDYNSSCNIAIGKNVE